MLILKIVRGVISLPFLEVLILNDLRLDQKRKRRNLAYLGAYTKGEGKSSWPFFALAIVTGHTRCKDLYLQQLRPPLKETLWWRGRSSENGYRLREKRRRNALESFYLREPFSISHYVSIR